MRISAPLLSLLLVHCALAALSLPTALQPDPTFKTGIFTVFSSSLAWSNTYTVTFGTTMATSSLNASIGIFGLNYNQRNKKHGFRTSIVSVTSSDMQLYVQAHNNNQPVNLLKVSYLVSYSPFLDINSAQLTFSSGTDVLYNSSISTGTTCFLTCRSYTATIAYPAKSSPKGIITLSSYYVINVAGPNSGSGSDPYIGIYLKPTFNAASLSVEIIAYGPVEISYLSFYYIIFEPNTIYSLHSRNVMWGRSNIGCTYDSNGCVNNSLSNTSYQTGSTFVNVDSPYNQEMVFYGMDRMVVKWDGTSNNYKVIFDSGPVTRSNTNLRVAFSFTGNTEGYFTMGFNYFTIQTYHCPDVAPFRYYAYNDYRCTDDCGTGYYPNATRYCQLCDSLCYTCTDFTTCTACHNSQNRVVNGSTCSCDVAGGFYDDGTSLVCPACNYTCKTCSGPSGGQCLSCQGSFYRQLSVNTCPCISGYFDNGTAICLPCHYTCASTSCTGTAANKCLTCNSTKYRTFQTGITCGCSPGYYDDSTSNETCKPCHYSCATCSTNNTNCLSCSGTNHRTLTSGTCPCNLGYFDNGVALCQLCDSTCWGCNGPLNSNCISCIAASMRTLNGSVCQCPGGQYDLSGTCTPCHYSCATCTAGTSLNCTSCSSTNLRTLANSSCLCNSGYVDAGAALCSPCSSSCLTCLITSTACTSCHPTTARFLAGSLCLCDVGYVDIFSNGTCTLCHYSCLTCSGTVSTCLTCPANRVLIVNSCLCPTGTYDNGISATCQPCASTCLNCTSASPSTCTACNSFYLRTLSPLVLGSCVCSGLYYDSGALLCQLCNSKCLTCMNTATNCTSCDPLLFRTITSAFTCECMGGYFNSGSLAMCQICSSSCLNCSTIPNNCTACTSVRYLSASNTCLCNNGTYQDASGVCQPCSYTCLTCSSASTACLTCPSGAFRTQFGSSCPCNTGYYDSGLITCQSCLHSCLTCSTGTTCISCPSNSFRTIQANLSCTCNPGYYDDGSSPSCQPCQSTCLTCQFFSQCLSCSSSQLRVWVSSTFTCQCPTSHYDPGSGACQPCHYTCLTCSGPASTNCLSCDTTTRAITTTTQCPCRVSFYQTNNICTPCSTTCLTCSATPTNCTACHLGSSLSNYQCLCSTGFYLNGLTCDPCDAGCATCLGSASTCTSCAASHGTVLQGSACVCADGKYQNSSTYACTLCNTLCLTCTGPSSVECLSCHSSVFRTFDSATKSCPCNAGYYSSGALLCLLCPSPCLTCKSGSTLNCSSCLSGYTLIGSSCILVVNCPSTYYYQGVCLSSCPNTTYPSAGSCLPCTSNCLTCISSSVCSSCPTSFYLLVNGSCQGSCPSGFYSNTTNNICIQCPTGCSSCTYRTSLGQIVCSGCAVGYYISGYGCMNNCAPLTHIIVENRCVRCLDPCSTCTNLTASGCLTCLDGYIYFNQQCLSQCPHGFYLNSSTCLPCPSSCVSCLKGVCQQCISGYYLSPSYQCTPNGYFISQSTSILTQCHANCLTCTDASFSSCIACAHFRGDYARMAISGYCECWHETVDLGDGTCDTEAYQSLQKSTQTLISTTEAATYGSALVGVLTFNVMAPVLAVYYQQEYGNMYFLNASAVGQTNIVVEQYGMASVNTFLRKGNGEEKRKKTVERLLYFSNVQRVESLFMRGESWLYLWEWALPIVILLGTAWTIAIVLSCIVSKLKITKKQSKSWKKALLKISTFMRQSLIILIHLFTTNEVFLYAFASFKIVADQTSHNILQLVLSVLLFAYYVIYLLRLFYVCCRYQKKDEEKNKFALLWTGFMKGKKGKVMARMYVPLLMSRSVCITLLMVVLSENSTAQISSVLGFYLIWCLYSLCYCPYPFYIRVFLRLYEFIFFLQLIVLTVSIFKPQYSRMDSAIVLLIFNYLQIANIIGLSLCTFLTTFYNLSCLKQTNSVTNSDPNATNIDPNANIELMKDQLQSMKSIRADSPPLQNAELAQTKENSRIKLDGSISMSHHQHLMSSMAENEPEPDSKAENKRMVERNGKERNGVERDIQDDREEGAYVELGRKRYRVRQNPKRYLSSSYWQ